MDEVLDKIREALKRKGLNQKKLAESLNVSEPVISRIMSKSRRLSVDMLIKVADKLEVDPASLLPGPNPENRQSFEEYIREIVREEIEKALKKK